MGLPLVHASLFSAGLYAAGILNGMTQVVDVAIVRFVDLELTSEAVLVCAEAVVDWSDAVVAGGLPGRILCLKLRLLRFLPALDSLQIDYLLDLLGLIVSVGLDGGHHQWSSSEFTIFSPPVWILPSDSLANLAAGNCMRSILTVRLHRPVARLVGAGDVDGILVLLCL